MEVVLEITRATRTRFITLKNMLLLLIATNLQIFSSSIAEVQSLPATVKLEVLQLLHSHQVEITPHNLPILLALNTSVVKIDFGTLNNNGNPVWTQQSANRALELIEQSSSVLDIDIRMLSPADRRPSVLLLYRMLRSMQHLQSFTLHSERPFPDLFVRLLPPNLRQFSLRCHLISNVVDDFNFVSMFTQYRNLVKLDVCSLHRFTPEALLLAIEELPNLRHIIHLNTEEALLLYYRQYGIARPLPLTVFKFFRPQAIPVIIKIVPNLIDVTFICPVVEAQYELLKYVRNLTVHQVNTKIDRLIEIWGHNLVKLCVSCGQKLNIALVAKHCPNLEIIRFSDVTDEVDIGLRVERGSYFKKVKEICYTPFEMVPLGDPWLPVLLSSKCLQKVNLVRVDLSLFINETFDLTNFENLVDLTLERCRDQQAIINFIVRLPFLTKLTLWNNEGQEEIHNFLANHPHIGRRVAISRDLEPGEDYLVVNFQYGL